jgi:hypothetical protein
MCDRKLLQLRRVAAITVKNCRFKSLKCYTLFRRSGCGSA